MSENKTIQNDKTIKQEIENKSIASLILGICSIVFSPLGIILGPIGLSFVKKVRVLLDGTLNGMAQAGYICNIIGIIISSVTALAIIAYIAFILIYVVLIMGIMSMSF